MPRAAASLRKLPLHKGFDWLIFGHFRMGRFSGATSSSMLRATPGWRRIKPARSMVSDHLVNRRWADAEVALHVGLGGRSSEHARVGVDEGRILALLFGEALPTGTTRSA